MSNVRNEPTVQGSPEQPETLQGEPERIDQVLVQRARERVADADRDAKEQLEIALWLKGLFDLLNALNERQLDKLHLKLMWKLIQETLAYRSLEVWIAEDRLIQSETGIRTDKQHKPFTDLAKWQVLQREYDDRGYRYRIQMDASQWMCPIDDECVSARVSDRKKYVRRKRRQLDFDLFSKELDEKITQLRFDAFADAANRALEKPDGKPIPHGGGIAASTGLAITQEGGVRSFADCAESPAAGESITAAGIGDAASQPTQPRQSPAAGESSRSRSYSFRGTDTQLRVSATSSSKVQLYYPYDFNGITVATFKEQVRSANAGEELLQLCLWFFGRSIIAPPLRPGGKPRNYTPQWVVFCGASAKQDPDRASQPCPDKVREVVCDLFDEVRSGKTFGSLAATARANLVTKGAAPKEC